MSPGFIARGPGRFSLEGTIPITLICGLSRPIASIAPITPAPPDMSYFISCMFSAGLIEMPPESKVSPLPTSASRSSLPGLPLYRNTISLAGSSLPARHAEQRAHAELAHALFVDHFNSRPAVFATSRARSAMCVGVMSLPGVSAMRRATFTASPTISPRRAPASRAAASNVTSPAVEHDDRFGDDRLVGFGAVERRVDRSRDRALDHERGGLGRIGRGFGGQGDRDRADVALAEIAHGGAGVLGEHRRHELRALAQADREHAPRAELLRVQERDLERLAADLATLDHVGERASERFVGGPGRAVEPAAGEDRDDERVGDEVAESLGGDANLHDQPFKTGKRVVVTYDHLTIVCYEMVPLRP